MQQELARPPDLRPKQVAGLTGPLPLLSKGTEGGNDRWKHETDKPRTRLAATHVKFAYCQQ